MTAAGVPPPTGLRPPESPDGPACTAPSGGSDATSCPGHLEPPANGSLLESQCNCRPLLRGWIPRQDSASAHTEVISHSWELGRNVTNAHPLLSACTHGATDHMGSVPHVCHCSGVLSVGRAGKYMCVNTHTCVHTPYIWLRQPPGLSRFSGLWLRQSMR